MGGSQRSRGSVFGIILSVLLVAAVCVLGAKYMAALRAEDSLRAKLAEGDGAQFRDALLALGPEQLKNDSITRGLAADRLRKMSFAERRELMRSDDLTDEDRAKLRSIMHEERQAQMEEHVREYFDVDESERERVLDRHIDEMLERFEEMRRMREAREAEGEGDGERERPRRERPQRDRQQAKERMEGGDPDMERRMSTYRSQMRSRMQARGIDFPRGPRGGGGPRGAGGGGRGPGGPGR